MYYFDYYHYYPFLVHFFWIVHTRSLFHFERVCYALLVCYLNYHQYNSYFLLSFNEHLVDVIYCMYVLRDNIRIFYDMFFLWILCFVIWSSFSQNTLNEIHYMILVMKVPETLLCLSDLLNSRIIYKVYMYTYYILRLYYIPILFFLFTPVIFQENRFFVSLSVWVPASFTCIYGMLYSHQLVLMN